MTALQTGLASAAQTWVEPEQKIHQIADEVRSDLKGSA